MSKIGINFRAAANYIADGTDQTYSLGEVYPITRAGWPFGWSVLSTANARDRLTNYGATVAGVVFVANGGATRDFTLDLKDGPGTYRVRLALGDGTNIQANQKIVIKDGAAGAALATITGTMSTVGAWFDATGVERVGAAWGADNAAIDLMFTGSQLVATLGNTGSGASALAHISVEFLGGAPGPTINTQPANQSAVAPATATFSVAATASGGSLSYQWQREPAAGGGFSAISGATSSSYTTGATTVSGGSHNNGDKYRCAVTDSNGTTNSAQAVLTVTAAASGPSITTQPSAQSVVAPAAATFSVAATTSGGALSYQWQRQPAAGGGYANISGATAASYTTGATSVTGGGHSNGDTYRCNVTDSNGTTTSVAATLSVSAASGSITTEIMVNNTGTPQASRPVHWSWLPAARIGSLASVAAQDGTGTTTAEGRLTATGLPAGAGVLMVAVRGATVADDAVYWQTGAVA